MFNRSNCAFTKSSYRGRTITAWGTENRGTDNIRQNDKHYKQCKIHQIVATNKASFYSMVTEKCLQSNQIRIELHNWK